MLFPFKPRLLWGVGWLLWHIPLLIYETTPLARNLLSYFSLSFLRVRALQRLTPGPSLGWPQWNFTIWKLSIPSYGSFPALWEVCSLLLSFASTLKSVISPSFHFSNYLYPFPIFLNQNTILNSPFSYLI